MTEIRLLDADALEAALPAMVALLEDSLDDNASMGFMAPFDGPSVRKFWQQTAAGIRSGSHILFIAEEAGEIVGTVQVGFAQKANQPHRADLMKLIVLRSARGRGIARRLMEAAEAESLRQGRWLLVLDTATGSPAEAIYPRLGWNRVGEIPLYALNPDGSYCGSTYFYKKLVA
ncbi:GNAT family N-acetyltransferase [Martelella endophytica]|uniref:GCN5 family acetyltransferase n=1 Tax=Martelella endophytica TaxID=1486262 RepID=A0A0D5LS56_MAREN|nr:GNAT family N-acetyltransferase [Martelella endophytica]AJY46203.1 GCN5 family acetyltransferase [Martelella endophytica]